MAKDPLLIFFRKAPWQNSFLLFVTLVHSYFLIIILVSPSFAFHKKEHKPLVVKTITAKPQKKTNTFEKKNSLSNSHQTSQIVTAKPAQSPTPAPKILPSPKKEAPKIPVQKSTSSEKKEPAIADKKVSKAKPTPKKNPTQQTRATIPESLLKELEESIAKIENKSDKGTTNKKASISNKAFVPISLQIDTPSSEFSNNEEGQGDYTETLINHLHQCLSLPDYGEVKIQLSLRQDGTVDKVVVLKTQSEKNRQYLENHLPRLRFPRFDGSYASKKEWTFTLTFCNE